MKPQKQSSPKKPLEREAAPDRKTLDDLELSEESAEGVTGGVTASDIKFVKKLDKSSP